MTFNGDLEKLQEFIDRFKSYKDSIDEENENISSLMSGFSSAIRMAGNSYDDQVESQRTKFVSAKESLSGNLGNTISELQDLLSKAIKAKSQLDSLDTKNQNIDRTV